MSENTFVANKDSSTIAVQNGNKETLDKVFDLLETRGFTIQTDQEILKEYPLLANTHWEGFKGKLLFKANIYPAGFKLEFYQEVVTQNRHGGYYDSDKFKKMPYLTRCEYILNRKHICELLESEGFINETKPVFKYAFDEVINRIKTCWHYEEGKELPDHKLPTYNAEDRDNKRIYNGQVKYFRDHKGRLKRGTVYHNINNMWWVVLNKREFTNVASFHLFDISKEDDLVPKKYSKRIPERIKVEKARKRFNEEFSYSMLQEIHINHLRLMISEKLINHDKEINMSVKVPRKKDTVALKTKGLRYAAINVSGSYFDNREGITFNENGFIGFAGWASDYNVKPFVEAFVDWMDWFDKVNKQVA
ncbi:hypothetical protein [Cytobacillus gottheilii]|uniref:hypothetical protein n=1 Tax=Cytobacillus gottheilii TaxID=859144 RepID=UPI0009BB1A72|nr:hypothetical protein [Cytobacillus gottheilii]